MDKDTKVNIAALLVALAAFFVTKKFAPGIIDKAQSQTALPQAS